MIGLFGIIILNIDEGAKWLIMDNNNITPNDFADVINPLRSNFIEVNLNNDYVDRIKAFAEKIAESKTIHSSDFGQTHYRRDNRSLIKRYITGTSGEAAVEELLGITVVDWRIGNATQFNRPDIQQYNVGVKTIEYGNFPIIFKKNFYPQIMCIKEDDAHVLVCGIATIDVLNKYQSDSLILDSRLRARGTKTGFYGFDHLKQIHSVDDIADYKK